MMEQTYTAIQEERTIQTVTLEIRALQKQAQQIILGYAIEIGRRLVEAKAMLAHGSWGDWLKNEVSFSTSSANNFMRIFEEYGSAQQGLFGPEANSQTLGNLPYTKALALLALPEEEREEFANTHDVESMSTRELNSVLKELEEEKQARRQAEEDARQAEERLRADAEERDRLEREVREMEQQMSDLKSRPIEVQGAEVPDAEQLEAARREGAETARKETEAELQKKIDKAKSDLSKAKERADQAEAKAQEEQEKREQADDLLQRERETMSGRVAALEKELRVSGSREVTAFQVHFNAMQETFGRMAECLADLEGAGDMENHGKLVTAMQALLTQMLEQLPEGTGAGEE